MRRTDKADDFEKVVKAGPGTTTGRIRRLFMERLRLTCSEIAETLGLSHQTVSARLNELLNAGFIRRTRERKVTASGAYESVYEWIGLGRRPT